MNKSPKITISWPQVSLSLLLCTVLTRESSILHSLEPKEEDGVFHEVLVIRICQRGRKCSPWMCKYWWLACFQHYGWCYQVCWVLQSVDQQGTTPGHLCLQDSTLPQNWPPGHQWQGLIIRQWRRLLPAHLQNCWHLHRGMEPHEVMPDDIEIVPWWGVCIVSHPSFPARLRTHETSLVVWWWLSNMAATCTWLPLHHGLLSLKWEGPFFSWYHNKQVVQPSQCWHHWGITVSEVKISWWGTWLVLLRRSKILTLQMRTCKSRYYHIWSCGC